MEREVVKSRKEKRKEARVAKRQSRLTSWVQHQNAKKARKSALSGPKTPPVEAEPKAKVPMETEEKAIFLAKQARSKKPKLESKAKAKKKTKFEEFIEMETGRGGASAEDDLEMERRLAKKLKVKHGKLSRNDDGMDELLDGVPSVSDLALGGPAVDEVERIEEEGAEVAPLRQKKRKKKKLPLVTEDQPEDDAVVPLEDTTLSDGEDAYEEAPVLSGKKGKKKKKKPRSKFEEFLEMEAGIGTPSADDDRELERRLAKKLKVKSGKLSKHDDGLDELLEGIPSVIDSVSKDSSGDEEPHESEEEGKECAPITKKRKRRRKSSQATEEQPDGCVNVDTGGFDEIDISEKEHSQSQTPATDTTAKYVVVHLRAGAKGESDDILQIRRRVRGILNRISESNVESITEQVSIIFRSTTRSIGCQVIIEEVIAICSGGPRGNEQYAAVFAAFIAGMACLVGVDFSAKLIAFVAKSFEVEFSKEDGLSLRNLTLLLSYLCAFGVCSSDLIYDFLSVLSKRLTEMDVSTILTILQYCGMKLRGDDPSAMKDFIVSIRNRVNELKSLSVNNTEKLEPKINSKRMEFMLETICDIKNNKRGPKEDPTHHNRLKKWLQKLGVGGNLLRGLTWSKLLDPEKKGLWWLSGEIAPSSNIEEVVTTINTDVLEAQKLVKLAAEQRMNTDIRRAIFCILMSGEDYIDAFEKILRLDLSGKQDREVMRVLVECCLQEKVFNKYYTILASKFCSHDKNQKFTLQYCIWDHFKELETMELHRSVNLARFVAEMLSTFTLSLSSLKTVDLADLTQLSPKRIMHFRMLFEAVFENTDAVVWNMFTRVAATPELEVLRSSLVFFIKQYVVDVNPGTSLAGKYKVAKKALDNMSGIFM